MKSLIILPQIFSLIGAVLLLYSTFSKTKKNILLIQTGDCVFNAMAGLLAWSYASASTNLISAVRNVLTAKELITKAIAVAFAMGICTIGLIVNQRGLIGILSAIASVQYTLWMFYAKATRTMKIGLLINVAVWFIHDIVIGLYPAMVVDIIIIVACIYNILIKHVEKRCE